MTSPVGRVALTDEQLAKIERAYKAYPKCTTSQLLAELRASRARERQLEIHAAGLEASLAERVAERDRRQRRVEELTAELSVLRPALRAAKGRIDKALARIDKAEPRQHRRVAVMRDIRAALTGTEDTDG